MSKPRMVDMFSAELTKRDDLATLFAALGAGNGRYVGGAVRDTLLGLTVKDIDVATPLRPDEVITRLNAAGIRNIPTGIAHGTVTAVIASGPVEITTLRHDVSTDGRHAKVEFAQDWREDAARRDFTINALYADPVTGEISDWFGGLDDLAAKRVRFIGDPEMRIREDHLRILRYFRFQARFGSLPADTYAEDACAKLASTLKGLSRERVGMEMMNLLSLSDPAPTIVRMAELGVLEQVFAEAEPAALCTLIAHEKAQGVAPDPVRRLAALIPPDPNISDNVAALFRLSNVQKKRLAKAASRLKTPGNARALAYEIGRVEAYDQLLLAGADTTPLEGWDIPQLPIKGGDIVAKGVKVGPQVAATLQAIKTRWAKEGFPDRERVLAILDEECGPLV